VEQQFYCLDCLPIQTFPASQLECVCGILLEIWPSGGLIHADEPMVKGQKFTISVNGSQVEAEIESSQQDGYGSYLAFKVSKPWFPESYQPPYLNLKTTGVLGTTPKIPGATPKIPGTIPKTPERRAG
jgi:hypothetical protein